MGDSEEDEEGDIQLNTNKKRKASSSPQTNYQAPAIPTETKISIPPIFMHNTEDWKRHQKDMKTISNKFTAQVAGRQIKLNLKDSDEYRKISEYLQIKNIPFHTYALKAETKKIKVILRGLLIDTPTDDIRQELVDLGFKVNSVHQLKKQATLMPLFLCILEGENTADIYKINCLQYLKVNWEGYRSLTKEIRQCYKCQRFGHSSLHCHAKPRCVKCPLEHDTRQCNKSDSETPYCVNCETRGHPANYRGCQTYLRMTQPATPGSPRPQFGPPTVRNEIQAPRLFHSQPSTSAAQTSASIASPRANDHINATEFHNYSYQRRGERRHTPKPKPNPAKNPFEFPQPHKSQPDSSKIYDYSQALKSSKTAGTVAQASHQVFGAVQDQINFITEYINNIIQKLQNIVVMLTQNA